MLRNKNERHQCIADNTSLGSEPAFSCRGKTPGGQPHRVSSLAVRVCRRLRCHRNTQRRPLYGRGRGWSCLRCHTLREQLWPERRHSAGSDAVNSLLSTRVACKARQDGGTYPFAIEALCRDARSIVVARDIGPMSWCGEASPSRYTARSLKCAFDQRFTLRDV